MASFPRDHKQTAMVQQETFMQLLEDREMDRPVHQESSRDEAPHATNRIDQSLKRLLHADSTKVSGRASEIAKKGFCILPYDKQGTKYNDVWEIIPEDEWRTDSHCAPFPEELCAIPIEATCPPGGVVLDPFCGTGTSIVSAVKRQRKGVGIDISRQYIETSKSRLKMW